MGKEEQLKINEETQIVEAPQAPMGFEDESEGDLIVPRVKVVQDLSPERKDKVADTGDIINSLTKERLNGKTFIPVFKFNNNIWWKPRAEGGGIKCIARDGKLGTLSDNTTLICAQCRLNEFDNSKQGVEAQPKCTKYINFFGFFEDDPMPIILSFAKTNYNEGKKLFSLAKVTMQNMWNSGYRLDEKKVAKGGNEWFIINTTPVGPVSEDLRAHALALYQQFRNNTELRFDTEDTTVEATDVPKTATDDEIERAEF